MREKRYLLAQRTQSPTIIRMRVSAKAEYACVAMWELAANYADTQPVRVKTIADAHGIPLRFLVQILLQLKAAGLAASTRGASGGYYLTRPPKQISIGDIINAIDRASMPREEMGEFTSSLAVQALRSVWRDVQAAQDRLLAEISLADFVRRTQESQALTYQI